MATEFKSIPLIDISPLLQKWDELHESQNESIAEVVKKLDEACKNEGFFYVTGHGIPLPFMEEIRRITRKYFDQPSEDKLNFKLSASTGYRGYQAIHENITTGIPDMQEAIDFYREIKEGMYGDLGEVLQGPNLWPSFPPDFKQLMEFYINQCTDISRNILRGISLALAGSAKEIESKISKDPFWVLRTIGYPPSPSSDGQDNARSTIGCGAHTDYGLLTLLNQDDDILALEVKNKSGEWIPASPIKGTFICNVGDMLKILSNGLYESTLHRVINSSGKYRVCVAYFYEPNFDAEVEPLDVCVQNMGGIKKFEGACYGKHLVNKVTNNFVME
ncbi:homoarginine-6-hydroxylase 2-ODD-C23.1-like [Nicotiana tabacum]|uniref:homoarginine-6-hydroxylase 2-ODD-C23.1-like n=1 Tax=Nicotiana tabacum TaxID=4097 RepID=UPI003F4E4A49